MKRIWITSDWHFNHEPIKEFENRPDNYEKILIKKINNQVHHNDILINLWDVIFSRSWELKQYLARINCKNIILVRWNHDTKSFNFYMNQWFSFVCDEFKLSFEKYKILFSHIPQENLPNGYINIHGHLHSNIHRDGIHDGKHILYNPEKTWYNFVPILLRNIIKKNIPKQISWEHQ